ncbi:hypothetical protein [Flexistipes sp.]|nr:hypothetical protein [Flexistipes sp.]
MNSLVWKYAYFLAGFLKNSGIFDIYQSLICLKADINNQQFNKGGNYEIH